MRCGVADMALLSGEVDEDDLAAFEREWDDGAAVLTPDAVVRRGLTELVVARGDAGETARDDDLDGAAARVLVRAVADVVLLAYAAGLEPRREEHVAVLLLEGVHDHVGVGRAGHDDLLVERAH